MKTHTQFLLVIGITTLIVSCSNDRKESLSGSGAANSGNDKSVNQFLSANSISKNGSAPDRKFIRTAELKFKVKNVSNATYEIENICNRFGGFVTYTDLHSDIVNKTIVPVSEDSSLETVNYSVVNAITFRVPNTNLDTALNAISSLVDYLDYRIIKADDVSLQILGNKLSHKRAVKTEQRLTDAIDNRGKKLRETTNAEELLSEKEMQSDNATISNLSLDDQVNFSTVTLSIYQRQSLKRELISNDRNIDAFKPGFGSRIAASFESGWSAVQNILVFVAKLWWLIIFAVVLFLVWKKYADPRIKAVE